jgi:VWFA-related protein
MAAITMLLVSLLCLPTFGLPLQKRPVFVTASFLGKNRMYLEDLSREEVRVFENGQPRQVEFFAGTEVPTTCGILFDRSILPQPFEDVVRDPNQIPSSMAATNVAYQLIDQVLGRQPVWVGTYDKELQIAIDFTQDSGRIKDVIQRLRSERLAEEPSLYRALFGAVKKMSSRNEKRRVLIVILENLDMETGSKLRPLKNLLSASNVELFVAGFAASRSSTGRGLPPAQSEACLHELAGVTAGAAYFAKTEGIEGIGRRISNQIRTLYTVGFEAESVSEHPATLKIECIRTGIRVSSHPVIPDLQ